MQTCTGMTTRRTYDARRYQFVERTGTPAPPRVVYAADGVPVPTGVIVRPLEEHPAIVEDMQAQSYEATEREKREKQEKKRPPDEAELELRIRDYLIEHDSGTVETIAQGIKEKAPKVFALLGKSERFRVLGSVEQAGRVRSLWALAEEKQ